MRSVTPGVAACSPRVRLSPRRRTTVEDELLDASWAKAEMAVAASVIAVMAYFVTNFIGQIFALFFCCVLP